MRLSDRRYGMLRGFYQLAAGICLVSMSHAVIAATPRTIVAFGDSLMAGVLTALAERGALQPGTLGQLDTAALEAVLRFGAVVAGINCGRKGCQPPTRAEVDAVLGT